MEDQDRRLILFKIQLWTMAYAFTRKVWKDILILLHPQKFANDFEFLRKHNKDMFNLQIEHVCANLLEYMKSKDRKQNVTNFFSPKTDIFMSTATDIVREDSNDFMRNKELESLLFNNPNIPTLETTPRLQQLLRDCQKIGLDLQEVWSVVNEQANKQSKYMLKLVQVTPSIPKGFWECLNPNAIMDPFKTLLEKIENIEHIVSIVAKQQTQSIENQSRLLENQSHILEALQRR